MCIVRARCRHPTVAVGGQAMSEKKAKSKSGTGTLIVRLIVFGGLGVLLVLAFLDFQQRKNAERTLQNIEDKFESDEFGDIRRSHLKELIVGAPESSVAESRGEFSSIQIETLTWQGPFRRSRVVLYLALPKDDPSVMRVEKAGGDATK